MAWFSNGTEGLWYQEDYCFNDGHGHGNYCVNYKDNDDGLGVGCPVWDQHLWLDPGGDAEWADICNYLIPIVEDETGAFCNGKCIWHNKELVLYDEGINLTLDDWKLLERGDIDTQLRFDFVRILPEFESPAVEV